MNFVPKPGEVVRQLFDNGQESQQHPTMVSVGEWEAEMEARRQRSREEVESALRFSAEHGQFLAEQRQFLAENRQFLDRVYANAQAGRGGAAWLMGEWAVPACQAWE